jgi:4-amino-4-deoxy-L-arabinose transferase-like glycosyltransferase
MSEPVGGETSDAAHDGPAWFMPALAAVTLLGFAVRVAYVLIAKQDKPFGGDAFFYHRGANLLADGHGFIEPFGYPHLIQQAAEHPPLYLLYLAIPSVLGMTSTLTHLLWSCVLGGAAVFVVGLLGREVLSPRVGVVAAVVAALYPNLWIPDGSLEAETAAIFTTALTLLLAYRYLRRPGPWRLVAVGAAAGAAALTRSELILLAPFVVVPLGLLTSQVTLRTRIRWLAAAALATLVVIGPWVGFNIARFRHPVYLSVQYPALLASANCDPAYHGRLVGSFSIDCTTRAERAERTRGDESQVAVGLQRAAVRYIEHHLGRVPVVVAARLGRVLDVFRAGQNLTLREYEYGVEPSVATAALATYYLLAATAIIGAVILHRRHRPLLSLLAVPAIVVVSTAITYGSTRFRAPAELVLAVLAAIAIDSVIARVGARAPH